MELDNIKVLLLSIPFVWTFFIEKYSKLQDANKAISKMSNSFRMTNLREMKENSSEELTGPITSCVKSVSSLLKRTPREKLTPRQIKFITNKFLKADLSYSLYFSAIEALGKLIDECDEKYKRSISQSGLHKDELKKRYGEIKEAEARFLKLRNDFLSSNLRLVISFAVQYQHLGMPIEDLIQEGNVALIRAIEKFNPKRDLKFSTYASWWIRQAFIRALRDQGRTIRLPANVHELISRIHKTIAQMEKEGIRNISAKRIAEKINVDPALIEKMNEIYVDPISLETEISGGRSNYKVKLLKDFLIADIESPLDVMDSRESSSRVREAIRELPDLHRTVLSFRYGLDRNKPFTLEETAREIQKSRDKVKKIETEALKILRKKLEDRI
jgi:RNA polymerase primary sigma factor